MTKKKAGFGRAVKQAAETEAGSPATRRTGGLGIKIDEALLFDVRELAVRLSRGKGARVSLVQLTEEAYRDLLAKYARKTV